MNKRQIIPFIALLASFLLWLYLKPEVERPTLPEHHPSYIADDVLSNHYDQSGFNDYRFIANKMTNYPEDEITLFESPKVVIYQKDEKSEDVTIWQLTSETGTLHKKNKLILSGDVLIENLSKDQFVQTMQTEKATVMLDIKEITSESKVSWAGPQMRQEGVGMWVSMITEEMKLNSNIKAIYLNDSK